MIQSTIFEGYWNREEQIARLQLPPENRDTEVFFVWHTSQERYGFNHREIGIKLTDAGERDYVHVKACYFVPRIILDVSFTPPVKTKLGEEIGQVTDSRVVECDRHFFANLQAWYYPTEKTLMLWEVDLFSQYRGNNPTKDFLLSLLWCSFEERLLKRFSDCEKIVTLGHEPKYDVEKWRKFLTTQGYAPNFDNTFIKYRTDRAEIV